MTPSGIFDIAQTVLDCACSAMDDLTGQDDVPEGYACPCLVYVSAGEPAVDCCDVDCTPGGMLTVHVESVFPSSVFPGPLEGFEPCKAATWVASIVVTAARCAPTVDEEGNLPDVADLTASAELQALDQYAILTALSCCVVNDPPPHKKKRRIVITASQPLVSEGGCASVEVRANVELGPVCACVPATS